MVKFLIATLVLSSSFECLAAKPARLTSDIGAKVEAILKSENIRIQDVGILVAGPDGSEVVNINGKKPYISASVMKIVTGLAALEEWGPAFQFQTQVLVNADDVGPALKGPVFLKGGGDPSFISEKMWYLVNELTRDDISSSEGGLVVDESRFDNIRFDEGRLPSQEDRAFDAPVGALSFNWNSINIFVRPGSKVGQSAIVKLDPVNGYTELVNDTTTVAGAPKKPAAHLTPKKGFGEYVKVSGPVGSQGSEVAIYRMISEPDLWAGSNFLAALQQRGIIVRGGIRRGKAPGTARVLRAVPGFPMRKVVEDMLKFSNNFVAEMLTKNLAAERGEQPATMKTGLGILKEYLGKWGIPNGEYTITSPSGLSRQNLLSANVLVKVLQRTEKQFGTGPEFLTGLPIGGVDGTLGKRMQDPDLKGHVRAKTGMLDGVISLAGYVEQSEGKLVTFAFLYNGGRDYSIVHRAFDKICKELTKVP